MRRILTAVAALAALAGAARAEGDVAKGEQTFKLCQACHAVGPGAKNKVGPELNGVVGRKWAAVEGYAYSQDLTQGRDQGKVWDEATLSQYLENPKSLVPKGKMAFAGVKKEDDRKNVIAYLAQFDAQGNKK